MAINTKNTSTRGRNNGTKANTTANKNTTDRAKNKAHAYWTDITGVMRVWGREIEYDKGAFMSYSASVGTKNDSGEYDNVYYNVRFKKDESPCIEGAFLIDIESGFLTVTVDKKGNTYPAVMVLDYDIIEE